MEFSNAPDQDSFILHVYSVNTQLIERHAGLQLGAAVGVNG